MTHSNTTLIQKIRSFREHAFQETLESTFHDNRFYESLGMAIAFGMVLSLMQDDSIEIPQDEMEGAAEQWEEADSREWNEAKTNKAYEENIGNDIADPFGMLTAEEQSN